MPVFNISVLVVLSITHLYFSRAKLKSLALPSFLNSPAIQQDYIITCYHRATDWLLLGEIRFSFTYAQVIIVEIEASLNTFFVLSHAGLSPLLPCFSPRRYWKGIEF